MKFDLPSFLILKQSLKGQAEIRILSGSMHPWIKEGETIEIVPCKASELKPFDIIVYWEKENEILICHIYTKTRDGMLITKPLAKNKEDKPVPPEHLLGRVINPRFKWFHKFLLKLNF